MESLIQGLIERTGTLLPLPTKASPHSQASTSAKLADLRQNASSLVKLAKFKLDAVIEGLLHLFSTLLKTHANMSGNADHSQTQSAQDQGSLPLHAEEKDLLNERFVRSKIIVFQLFSKTLSAAIGDEKLDIRFDDDFLAESDELYNREEEEKLQEEKEKKQQEQKQLMQEKQQQQEQDKTPDAKTPSAESQSTPVQASEQPQKFISLDASLSTGLLKYIVETLFPPVVKQDKDHKIPLALKYLAARVLFKLSVVSFDIVFQKVELFFKAMKSSDDVDPVVCGIIEYMNCDMWKLTKLIALLNEASPKFKKNAFPALSQPVRQAIWNWISNYPQQFIKLCQAKSSLPGNPLALFDTINTFCQSRDKKTRRSAMWPLQSLLLLLCPDVISTVIMQLKQGTQGTQMDQRKTQRKFLTKVLDALRAKDKMLSDSAMVCIVDLYKASTYLSKSELSALRFLVSDVQNDVQERLMNMESIKPDGKITVRLMVDFLVSAYRINQRHVTSYIFPLCLRGNSLYKLVMTKAMLKLAQEGATLPWHPTLSESYTFLAKPVRLLFQDLMQEERQLQQRIKEEIEAAKNARRPVKPPSAEYITETLLNLLAAFYTDPKLVLENTSGQSGQHINEILYLFGGLCNCLGDQNNTLIQNQGYKLLQKLFDIKYIERWCPQDVSTGFIELSSAVLTHLSVIFIADKDCQGQNLKILLDLGKELTSSANRFIEVHLNSITPEHVKSRKRIQSLENAESALLVLLCSSEPEIWATAASCFGDLCDQIDVLGDREIKQNSIYNNYNLYRAIAKVVEDSSKGRTTQAQKTIRKLLRRVELQTKANLSAFIEVYSRWKTYTNALLQSPHLKPEEKGPMEKSANPNPAPQLSPSAGRLVSVLSDANEASFNKTKITWKNYTAFLCSLGGVCLQSAEGVFAQTSIIPANAPQVAQKSRKDQNSRLTDDLMKDLLKLVGNQTSFIRDGVSQTIGTDLSPALYGILFQHLHANVATFFGEEGSVKVSDNATQFTEQAIFIVKSILEQAQENSDDLSLANFESLISSFVKYCSQLVRGVDSVRIKCKLCILIETMLNKKEFITFKDEIEFRFSSLRQIVEWTSDFTFKSQEESLVASIQSSPEIALFKDLDVLCLRAVAALLKDLALAKLKRDKKMPSKEKEEANKKEFFKYFSFLSRYLQRSKTQDKEVHPQLREFTIQSLGNLLESNINYGLEHFMKMAYIEDQETRSAFLAVLTKIMKQGIQLEAEDSQARNRKKYDKLMEFLTKLVPNKPDELEHADVIFHFMSVVSISEQDILTKIFVRLFAERGVVLQLIKTAVNREIDQTLTAGTLFRANSPSSKMLTAFCHLFGKTYLGNVLSSHLQQICSNPGQFEVDGNKLKQGEDLKANADTLMNIAQQFLDSILNSYEEFPKSLKIICSYLAKKVEEKFPVVEEQQEAAPSGGESSAEDGSVSIGKQLPKLVAIGGLIFLRFLNPTIVAPQANGLVQEVPSRDASRCLVLSTKLLQNVANGLTFGKKEGYMKAVDSFIYKNHGATREFFAKLSQSQVDEETVQIAQIEDESREDMINVHRILYEYADKLAQRIQAETKDTPAPEVKDSKTRQQTTSVMEKIQTILADLGKPPEQQAQQQNRGDHNKDRSFTFFYEFMNTMVDEAVAKKGELQKIEERNIFFKGGVSKAGRPVFYFIGRLFDLSEFDADLFLYHCLNLLKTFFTKPYELLFDCTELREEQELRIAHITKLHRLLPTIARKNLAKFIIYNPNEFLKDQTKTLSRILTRKNSKKIEFCTSIKELSDHIEDKNMDLPEASVECEKNIENTISPAWYVGAGAVLKDCIIKLSNKKLCIITKKDSILGIETKRVDFIDLPSINKMRIEKNQQNQQLEQVVILTDNKTIYLKTDSNEQLLQAIKAAKARHMSEYRLAASLQTKTTETENIRQSDIPGSVLNMCFLNLESMFPKTRSAAYNLLAALAEQFDFPVTLLETQNMCVPHNTGDLVVKLSEQVAIAKPFLTQQFLRESLRGFQKISLPYKFLCLKYMRPWIKNLSIVISEAKDDAEQTKKQTEWFQELTKTTVEMNEIYPALLSELWGEISLNNTLVDISMSCLLQEAISSGLENPKIEILNDLVVTLASHEGAEIVVGSIMEKIMQTFDHEIKNAEQPLENNPPWAKVIIYCRFLLMLSFQDRIKVLTNLPILLHIITLLIGRGSIYIRATIHALVLNIVHSLATVIKFDKEEKKKMQEYLANLSSVEYRKIFMGNITVSSDPFVSAKDKNARNLEPITMWDLETITTFFLEVMETCYKTAPELREAWYPTWIAICQNELLRQNPVMLPRILAVNGILVQHGEAQKTISFIMKTVISSFTDYPQNNNVDLPVAALLCLGQYCMKISPDDPLLHRMTLVPLILLSASDSVLFLAVVHLLSCVLKAISKSNNFVKTCNCSFEQYFNTFCRDNDSDDIVNKLEKSTGISFKINFSFAISSLLMKGLTISATRERTAHMCATLVRLSTGSQITNASEMLGYLAALIPNNNIEIVAKYLPLANIGPLGSLQEIEHTEGIDTVVVDRALGVQPIAPAVPVAPMAEMHHHVSPSGEEGKPADSSVHMGETIFYMEETFDNPNNALLFVRYLLTVVQNMEFDNDKISIYSVLQQAFLKLTNVFAPVYSHVIPRVISVYNQASSIRIAELSLSLINTMMATDTESIMNIVQDKDPLKEIGFIGLSRSGSFKAVADKQRGESLQIMLELMNTISLSMPSTVTIPPPPPILEKAQKKNAELKTEQKGEKKAGLQRQQSAYFEQPPANL